MEPQQFREMVLKLAQVKISFSDVDRDNAIKVSYTIRKFLQQRALATLQRFRFEPTLFIYMADGWGATVFDMVKLPIPGTHLVVTRSGRYRHEFLLQRGLIRISTLAEGTVLLPLIEEPLGMGLGKSAWNVYHASRDFFPSLRHAGQTGVCINLYLADGGLFDSLERKFRARHLLYYRCGLDLGQDAFAKELSDWTLCLLCPSHIMSNALKWGVDNVYDADILKATTIATMACISGSSAIHKNVDKFVFQHLQFTDTRSGTLEEISAFWEMLGVEGALLEEFVACDLDYKDGCLEACTSRFRHDLFCCRIVVHFLLWA